MNTHAHQIDATKILSQPELDAVLVALHTRAQHSKSALVNLVIFRLATFCGLRVSELIGLTMDDVVLEVERPFITVRAAVAKFHKSRVVPIWSDATIKDLRQWVEFRSGLGLDADARFICSTHADSLGKPISRQNARMQYKNAVKVLGTDRQRTLTIHDGRHTMCSMALHRQFPITAVRDALGHSSIAITNIYASSFDDGTGERKTLDCA